MDVSHTHDHVNDLRRAVLALLPALALSDTVQAQDAAKMQPGSYRVAFENDRLRVLEYRDRPGMGLCGQGMHSHPPHLTVVLFNGKTRVRTADGKVRTGEGKVGDVFWQEAETHEAENLSSREAHVLLIELKTPGKA